MILVVLTLGSFALVSTFISKQPHPIAMPSRAAGGPLAEAFKPTSAAPTNRQTAAAKQLDQDLSQAQTLLDQLRLAVLAGAWGEAQRCYDEFASKTQQLPVAQLNQPDISPLLQDFFTLYRVALAQAINDQHTVNARFALNQLRAIVSEQGMRTGTRGLPLEFNRLSFLTREIEFWAQLDNKELLHERRQAMRETWLELRPLIVARRNGRETAGHFDHLVEQLATVTTPDLTTLSNACLKDLKEMEALLQHASAHPAHPLVSPRINTGED